MNNWQRKRIYKIIVEKLFGNLSEKKIVILGFAFKADTGDTRESPAIKVCKELSEEHAKIVVSDPKALDNAKLDLANLENIDFEEDVYKAVNQADAIALLTDWNIYKDLDFEKIYSSMQKPAFIFDGRNVLDHEKLFDLGFEVYSIGKPGLSHLN